MAIEGGSGITGANVGYDYSYTKPVESERRVKEETKEAPKVVSSDSDAQKVTDSNKKIDETKQENKVKSLYDEQQEEIKTQEEERQKRKEKEERAEYLQDLTDQLNSRMNSFSENIKFGVNDRADSIIVSVMEQNNEKKIKELSKEDADKLFRRLDYVLGVLFDSKG